jgi:serine/threonine-protein kinase
MGNIFVLTSGGDPLNNQTFAPGSILINRYVIENYLAAGGMQEVYLCHDRTLNRKVVIKTPKQGVHDRRFKRGAEMGARVNHSNVAATFDYYEDENLTFMVEEYVFGRDLGQRLKDEFHFFDPALCAHVLHHIARALHEAHRVGICHRDLKPSNVMTSPDAGITFIKLTDFGIAKLAETELAVEIERFGRDNSTLTSSHTLLGAVPYMAPECWQDWKGAGQPMDIWALGCIGYHLLTGSPPFGSGASAIGAVLGAYHRGSVQIAPPIWFGQHSNSLQLEQGLWEIILSCLEVLPGNRPTALDILNKFDSLCYAVSPRRTGTISQFGVRYASGTVSKTGNISDSANNFSWFFHKSEFYGLASPQAGQKVSFSVYPGIPNPRCSPVLLIK